MQTTIAPEWIEDIKPALHIDENRWPDRNGRGHADCPFCEKPVKRGQTHFSIDLQTGAYYCHVCGRGKGENLKDIARHLGVDLNKPAEITVIAKPTPKQQQGVEYGYYSEDGTLLYQAVRFYKDGKKHFFARRPDGRGGWIRGLDDEERGIFTRRVLYRLPEVLQAVAAGETIFVVEGEKDVETLRRYGLVATTNVGGAGKWRDKYSDFLVGAKVIILPDNDEPGAKHARQVAHSLHGKAASIKIVSLPNLLSKGDVTDWFEAGNKIEALHELVAATPVLQPNQVFEVPVAAPVQEAAVASKLTKSEEIVAALTQFGYSFRLNDLDDRVEVNGQLLDDVLEAQIRTQLRDIGIKNMDAARDAWTAEAAKHRFHPIKDYLNELKWDGTKRIELLVERLKSDDLPIEYPDGSVFDTHAVYLLRWLIGAVAKALDGQQNIMLVLAGPQGTGKSFFAQWLCSGLPQHFIADPIDPHDKDCRLRAATSFIWEVGELDATTRRADLAALKHFITQAHVKVRKAYARHDIEKPALASFIGTLNPSQAGFLADTTGNRRFLVTHITSIDHSYTELDVHQLWAEAIHLYRNGEPWRLSDLEAEHQAKQNEDYQVVSLLDDHLTKYFVIEPQNDEAGRMSAGDIAQHLRSQGVSLSGSDRAAAMDLANALGRLGFAKPKAISGRGQRLYKGIRARH